MKVGAKSVGVSRQTPRSRARTFSPESVSSWPRMAAVHPNPTSTTSTPGSLRAMSASAAGVPIGAALQAHGRQGKALPVLAHELAIVVAGAGEADHAPGGHVVVAAMDGVGEEPLNGVLEQQAEKRLPADAGEGHLVLFELV